MTDKNFEKINIKVVINIYQCMFAPFQLIWRTLDFATKFTQKI